MTFKQYHQDTIRKVDFKRHAYRTVLFIPIVPSIMFAGYHEAMHLNEPTYAEIARRFFRGMLLIDVIVALIVGVISLFLDLPTWLAYGTLLRRAGLALIVLAGVLTVGGLSSRLQDVGAYNLSKAGNMSENLYQVAEAGRSSIGCSLLLLLTGISLLALGKSLQDISALFG